MGSAGSVKFVGALGRVFRRRNTCTHTPRPAVRTRAALAHACLAPRTGEGGGTSELSACISRKGIMKGAFKGFVGSTREPAGLSPAHTAASEECEGGEMPAGLV
eukprot:3182938-Rhodomonas_salina.1